MTRIFLAVLTTVSLVSCAKQPASAPANTVPSEVVSPACLKALRTELDGALYKPDAEDVSQLPECQAESEEAIGLAAEQLLREVFDSGSPSPSPAR
jgi:hypothetical protein